MVLENSPQSGEGERKFKVEEIRQKLLEELGRLVGVTSKRHPPIERTSDELELAARRTETYQLAGTLMAMVPKIVEITRALQKVEEGNWGLCDQCDQPIAEDRLKALPWAIFCKTHAGELGRKNNNNNIGNNTR